MNNLYICERPYPLYKTLLRCINSNEHNDIIISNHVEGMEKIYPILKESNMFENVYFFDDMNYNIFNNYGETQNTKLFNKPMKAIFVLINKFILYQRLIKKSKKLIFSPEIDFNKYNNIYVNDATSSITFHLFHNNINVVWVEHATDAYKHKNPTYYTVIFYMLLFLEKLKITFSLRGTSKYVKTVEVNENKNMPKYLKHKKIQEVSINSLIKNLSVEDKEKIYSLYAKAYNLDLNYENDYNLLLTTPLFKDGRVNSELSQINFYKKVIEKYFDKNTQIIIKAHPRDEIDYKKYFPNAIIINKSISVEVLSFSKNLKLNTALTCLSSSIYSFANTSKKSIRIISEENVKNSISIIKKYIPQGEVINVEQ